MWVNRLEPFKPDQSVVARYADILRRYGTKPNAVKFALQGSNYDANYRMMINRDSKAVAKLRELSGLAKVDPVYLVSENDLPDISILIDMATVMVGAGVW